MEHLKNKIKTDSVKNFIPIGENYYEMMINLNDVVDDIYYSPEFIILDVKWYRINF